MSDLNVPNEYLFENGERGQKRGKKATAKVSLWHTSLRILIKKLLKRLQSLHCKKEDKMQSGKNEGKKKEFLSYVQNCRSVADQLPLPFSGAFFLLLSQMLLICH